MVPAKLSTEVIIMANPTCALMVEWGMPKDTRETKALEEFMSHMSWWTQLKTSGKIAEFRTYAPITGDYKRAGLVIIEGTEKQIDELRHSEEFQVNMNRVLLVANDIQVTILETGDKMGTRMQRYGKTVKERIG
jgi:hypothetical protein